MKSNFIKKNYLEKIKKIQEHNNLYYNKSKPTIADQEYDILKKVPLFRVRPLVVGASA